MVFEEKKYLRSFYILSLSDGGIRDEINLIFELKFTPQVRKTVWCTRKNLAICGKSF